MKALFTPQTAIEKSITFATLLALIMWIYPHSQAWAQSPQSAEEESALVFEVNNQAAQTSAQNNTNSIDYKQILNQDPLVIKLQAYLEEHNSPLSVYAADIVEQPQWERSLAISWVESNFGIHCVNNNCSGIGGTPGTKTWRKYPNKLEWFKDMSQLMEKPLYKDRLKTFKQMKGVYVQPGSLSWVNGAQNTFNELTALETEAIAERQELAQKQIAENKPVLVTLATFPDLVKYE